MSPEGIPLSAQQRRLLVGSAGEQPSVPPAVCRVTLSGELDTSALEKALADVAQKYEILRTELRTETPGQPPTQHIHEQGLIAFGDAAAEDVPGIVADLMDRVRLQTWGVCVRLLPAGENLYELLLVLPAVCADRASLTNLVAELAAAYGQHKGEGDFDTEAMQYMDIAAWQADLLASEESAPGRAYWRDRDLSLGADVQLPFQLPSEDGESAPFEPAVLAKRLPAELARRIIDSAAAQEISPKEFLLCAWGSLVHRLTGAGDVTMGVTFEGREYEELADPLGPLARTLPVHLHLNPDASFTDATKAVSESVAAVAQWQECLDPGALDLPTTWPFGFEHREQLKPVTSAGVTFEILGQQAFTEPFLCHLVCQRAGDGFEIQWHHDPRVFHPDLIERLAGQFETLLASACEDTAKPVDRLDVLSPAEWKQLIVEFNTTEAEYAKDVCAHRFIEEHAQKTPEVVAVRQGDETLTYGELDARANQLAHHLQAMGVGPDTMVALCIDRSLEMVVAILGILKAGGGYVPVDPAYPTERVQFIVEDTCAPVLVTQSRLAEGFAEASAELVCMDGDQEAIGAHPTSAPTCAAGPENLVYVIYTSGSTGKPKGVVITHEKLVISNGARVKAFGHTPTAFLLLSSVAFDSSVVGIFWSLCGGGSLLLMPEGLEKEIEQIPAYIAEHNASHLLTLPSFYRHILEQGKPEQMQGLRAAIVAGEACPLKMVEHHRRLLPDVGLFSEYGATETTVFSSVYDCLEQTEPIAPLGDPIDNMQMYILDQHLGPCPMGVPGEVHFGGPAIAVAYWQRPELTAERFIPNPFRRGSGDRLYKSGDLARFRENGEMEFLGRLDNQVKIRGFRIELEEIEVALAKHPAIKEAAVLALADLGEEKRLVGYLAPEAGQKPSVGELRDFLLESLPEFMLPAVFMFLDDMPRTPNGKVDRKALPEPGSERPELESSFQAASTEAEAGLVGIWADVLGIDKVGINDNFFELGGDSILSIQVVSKANQAGIKITPRQVFENQTIAELVAVAEVTAEPAFQEDQGPVVGDVPLTPVQHWYFDLDLPSPQYWNMPILLELRRPVDPAHLEQALTALIAHHDALRSRFVHGENGWQQTLLPIEPCQPLVCVDLSGKSAAEQQSEFDRLAAEHQAALDLAQGPLVRAVLVQRGADEPDRLLWIVHHLVIDGVSWRILLEDLESALDQLERGEEVKLQPKTTSFQRWSVCLSDYAGTPQLATEAQTWFRLADEQIAALPIDRPGGDNTEASAQRVRVALDAELTRSLLSEVPRAYNTQINDVLLTALTRAFTQWTGAGSALFTLEGHGRQEIPAQVDMSRTVGWFTSDYPVLLKQGSGPFEPGAALRSTKDQLRALPNQGFSFGLGRYLSPDDELRSQLAHLPRPVVGFNYLGQFDQLFGEDARFRYCDEPSGPALGPDGERIFLLEVYGRVSAGKLEFDFEYSENLHDRATIESLAGEFSASLTTIIQHCLSTTGAADEEGLDSSDFADFDWSADDLSGIMNAIQQSQDAGDGEQ